MADATVPGQEGTSADSTPPTTQAEADEGQQLVRKRGATSVVWKWFGYEEKDVDQKTTLCKICRARVPSTDSNTSSLFYHLKKNHDKEYNESQRLQKIKKPAEKKKLQTQTVQESFAKGTPYPHDSKRWKDLTDGVAHHICVDSVPIYTVERRGFREMWRRADPRYELPSRKYMNKYVGGLYEKCRSKVEAEINSGMFYAATTDMWTSRAGHPYMSLTGHYIDTDWNLRSRCLQTSFFPDDHTGENIAKGFTDALASWGLEEDRLVCVTTDNASNNILAFHLNDMTRLQCFGHRLHLAIGKLRTTELFREYRDRLLTDNSVHSEWDKTSCDIEGSENFVFCKSKMTNTMCLSIQ